MPDIWVGKLNIESRIGSNELTFAELRTCLSQIPFLFRYLAIFSKGLALYFFVLGDTLFTLVLLQSS
jgi:hypothetical protein